MDKAQADFTADKSGHRAPYRSVFFDVHAARFAMDAGRQ
jgi:hypothetical protein